MVVLMIGLLANCAAGGMGSVTAAYADQVAVAEHDPQHADAVAHAHISAPTDGRECQMPDGLTTDTASVTQSRGALIVPMLALTPGFPPGVWRPTTPRGPPSPLPLAAKSGRDLLHHLCVIRR